jgi:hypothetical protein
MTTRRHKIRFAAVGLAMSGIMALAACGGDDSGDDTDSTTTEATVEAGSDDTATDETTTDETTADDPATEDTTSEDTTSDDSTETTFDTSDVDALSAEECRELYEKFVGLGFDPTSSEDPEDPNAAFEAIEDAVPDDLKEDVQVLREGFETITEASEKYEGDFTNPEYLEALESLNSPEFAEASARLEAFFSNCEDAVAD